MNDLFEKKYHVRLASLCLHGYVCMAAAATFFPYEAATIWGQTHPNSPLKSRSVDPMATCTETRVPQPTTLGLVAEGSQRQPAGSRVEFLDDETWKLQERMPPRMSLNLIYILLILGFCRIFSFFFFFLCFLLTDFTVS